MLTRFWDKVTFTDTCWLWKAGKHNKKKMPLGYGRFRVKTYVMQAHRLAWELIHAEQVPDHLVIDHRCRISTCVNPAHMEVVTQKVNAERQIKEPKTHCKRGHEFTTATEYWRFPAGRKPSRQCLICIHAYTKGSRA
jgi:hypothetical protein